MKRTIVVGLVALAQLGCVGAAVAPQLSAHLTGDTYVLRVSPLDPIDPFRGAYVQLDYQDLRLEPDEADLARGRGYDSPPEGELFVPLVEDGDVWRGQEPVAARPGAAPYLACDSDGWRLSCGIDSWFLPQDEALAMERDLADGAYAEVRIDDAGHAVLVDVRETP